MAQYSPEATQLLESMLCLDFSNDSGERVYQAREGYRTVFTGIFSDVNSVTVDGQPVDYYPAFFDKRNGEFFNSIVLENPVCGEVVIDAEWGFNTLPADLQRLLANADKVVNKSRSLNDVKSKKTEDFTITYGDLSEDAVFIKNNAVTIGKYGMCHIGNIQHGETCGHCVRCIR